jgi:hypothetical protein
MCLIDDTHGLSADSGVANGGCRQAEGERAMRRASSEAIQRSLCRSVRMKWFGHGRNVQRGSGKVLSRTDRCIQWATVQPAPRTLRIIDRPNFLRIA